MNVLLISGGLIALILIIGGIVSMRGEKTVEEERLEQIFVEDEEVEEGRASPITDWLNVRVERSTWGDRVSKQLAQADLRLKPGEYVILLFLSAGLLWLLGWYFVDPYFAVIAAVIGFFLPSLYIRQQRRRRLQSFNDQLPDMLNLMVNGLRAGYSTLQAMEAVSRELPPPINDEFRRVVLEMQLGLSLEHALDNLLRRIPSSDLDLIITAMNVQMEVGGNLAGLLETMAHTIRERIRVEREIQTLVAQVLYSGRILSLLPVALTLVLWAVNKTYIQTFSQNIACGIAALCLGGGMVLSGYYIMTRIADIEV